MTSRNPEDTRRAVVVRRLRRLIDDGYKLRNASSDDPDAKAWAVQVTKALREMLGSRHGYVEAFAEQVFTDRGAGVRVDVDFARSLLDRVLQDAKAGELVSPIALASARVFQDFIEMAGYLLENGYFQPAASLIGAVLEDGLRQIADRRGVRYDRKAGLTPLNAALASDKAYSSLVEARIRLWTTIRNKADHGEWSEFSITDVQEMSQGVGGFLADYVK